MNRPAATQHPVSDPSEATFTPGEVSGMAAHLEAAASPAVSGPATIELRIPARSEHVKVARSTVAAVASRMRFTFNEVEDIKLAVAEACNNAIIHAEPHSAAPTVDIALTAFSDRLEISVADRGRLSDPASLPSRSIPADGLRCEDDLPEGGLGLMLIRSLMDEVELLGGPHTDTVLRMVKRVKYGRIL